MYRLVILSIVAVSALAANVDKAKCIILFHPRAMQCCKKFSEVKDKIMKDDELKECFKLAKDPVSCEKEVCIAKKKGFATDDGKLDLKKFEEGITKEMADEPKLLDDIKSKCINGDLEKYGAPEFCDFAKMKHCVTLQTLNRCSEWNDNPNCNELKGMVADCVEQIS